VSCPICLAPSDRAVTCSPKCRAQLRLRNQRAGGEPLAYHRTVQVRGGRRCRDCGVEHIKRAWYRDGVKLEGRPQCTGRVA
jgi:hypothetical protein